QPQQHQDRARRFPAPHRGERPQHRRRLPSVPRHDSRRRLHLAAQPRQGGVARVFKMSLLLEALKKAELAKQIAKAEAHPPEPPTPEPATPVITREKLPDISQPLEILTEDLPPQLHASAAQAERPALSLRETEATAPATRPTPSAKESERSVERAQAQQLFQVKEMDYDPRRPFYLTLATLALVGLVYGGYVWWQMQPKQN